MMTPRHGRGALVMTVTAVLLITAGCSARHGGPAANDVPSATVTPSSVSSAEPAPTTTALADATRQWESIAGDHFTQSGQALKQVNEAAAAEDTEALGAGCRKLHDTNTVGLQHDLPTPDPVLTAELQRMIDDINTATHACVRFYLARAVEHLHRAKTILDADLAPK
jgi:hypothetical protein